jgi:hypothetical protein
LKAPARKRGERRTLILPTSQSVPKTYGGSNRREPELMLDTTRPLFPGGFANGVFGAADCVLHLARRLLGGSFSLRFRIASHLADGLLDGPFNPTGRSFNTVLVHIPSPKLPMINTRFGLLVSSVASNCGNNASGHLCGPRFVPAALIPRLRFE